MFKSLPLKVRIILFMIAFFSGIAIMVITMDYCHITLGWFHPEDAI